MYYAVYRGISLTALSTAPTFEECCLDAIEQLREAFGPHWECQLRNVEVSTWQGLEQRYHPAILSRIFPGAISRTSNYAKAG